MTIKTAMTREDKSFDTLLVYRELTYKLAYGRFRDAPTDPDAEFERLKAAATEQEPAADPIEEAATSLGLTGWELSKIEEYLVPTTLNTVHRGVAKKDGKEVRFYIERP